MRSVTTQNRTIFIGDVHGCITELKEMIHTLRPEDSDRIVLLGDMINRGPDSAAVVKYVHDSGYECLLGNHEAEYLMYFEKIEKYKKLHDEIGSRRHEWISKLPLYIEEEDFLAVHAGLVPGEHPSRSKKDILLNIRTWDSKGEDIKNPDNPAWYDFYEDTKPVFYGHWARQELNIRHNTIGLDSGCVYGRALSSCVLHTREIVQIKTKKVYYIPPSLRQQQKQNILI